MIGGVAPRLRNALGSGYLRNILVLLSGTAFAQLVPILASPLLTRLFSPADFGVLGLFSAVLSIAAVIACLRYEHAMLLERDTPGSFDVARMCLLVAVCMGALVTAVTLVGTPWLPELFASTSLKAVLWLVGPSLLMTGVLQVWSLWLLRGEQFGEIARARMVQALSVATLSIAFGIISGSGAWLVIATTLGQALTLAWLWHRSARSMPLPAIRWRGPAARIASTYRRFALFTVPADLLSAAAAQLPMFVLGSAFGVAAAGAFLLTQRVLGTPLAVVGSAVMDAYKRDAAAAVAASGDIRALTLRTIKHLALLSLVPWLVAVTVSPVLFRWVFGSEWETAGQLCQWLATPFFLRFITTPVSYNFYLRGRQSEDLLAQGYNLVSNGVLMWAGISGYSSLTVTMALYASNLTLVYAFYLVRSVVLARS